MLTINTINIIEKIIGQINNLHVTFADYLNTDKDTASELYYVKRDKLLTDDDKDAFDTFKQTYVTLNNEIKGAITSLYRQILYLIIIENGKRNVDDEENGRFITYSYTYDVSKYKIPYVCEKICNNITDATVKKILLEIDKYGSICYWITAERPDAVWNENNLLQNVENIVNAVLKVENPELYKKLTANI